jgi:hypothetical protein
MASLGFFGGGTVDLASSDDDSSGSDGDDDNVSRGGEGGAAAVDAAPLGASSDLGTAEETEEKEGEGAKRDDEHDDGFDPGNPLLTGEREMKPSSPQAEEEEEEDTKQKADTKSSALPSFDEAMFSTEGVQGSWTVGGASLGSTMRTGRTLTEVGRCTSTPPAP